MTSSQPQPAATHVPPDTLDRETIVAFLGSIFDRRGGEEYLGEPVTMGEHMLQGATIAEQNGQPEEIIVGALLHDIGHFTSEFGTYHPDDTEDRHHEDAGAEVLERFFPSVITDCCRYHVAAKRYLCATKPEYFKRLSPASVHTLELQGGQMNAEEVAAFEANPNLKEIIAVRYLDEAGKREGMETPDFWHFAPMVQRMVDRHCGMCD
ncbi:HD domain-containing protein [Phaeobacter porticola]|uniref:Putative HD phosphohydrolase n=1 Tax=Phaeobacter porticola TaxID=1844006 RepID=A0A1L3I7F3_9RHOB|nr:HD domain-containing protein [Phaeobacter porticola]APG48045.1 putative HD phosphohydrolase [Phaeobacter porticola]